MKGFLSLAIVCMCGHLTTATWTQAHRDEILKIHNDYRRGVKGACDMTDLVYDKGIEAKAKLWAKKCWFKHQQKGFGENIAWITKYEKEPDLLTKMAKMWYDEVKDYTYGMYGCGDACHYTQLIWANTKKVGCYAADCKKLKEGGDNAYFLVCFYTPPGNFQGEQPYKKVCKKDDKNKGGSNTGSSSKKNKKNKSKNNKNIVESWEPSTKDLDDVWDNDSWGDNDGWKVVETTGGDGKGGKWKSWSAKLN